MLIDLINLNIPNIKPTWFLSGNTTSFVASGSTINVSCYGGNNGSIDVSVWDGTPPYTYLWNDSVTTQDRIDLSIGTYSVIINDSINEEVFLNFDITQPIQLISSGIITNILCYGSATGIIDLSVSGGVSPYTYLWSDSVTTQDRTNLSIGTYSVVITDDNGCITNNSFILTQPSVITLSTIIQVNHCYGANEGAIALSVSGGVSPYTYLWNDSVTTQNRTGLVAGIYSVAVTDSNGCVTTSPNLVVTQPVEIDFNETISTILCYGGVSRIDTYVSGGVSPYTYRWLVNGSIYIMSPTTSYNDVCLPGNYYNCVVTDSNNCVVTSPNWTITQPTEITITHTQTNISCYGNNTGAINLTVDGGTHPDIPFPYTYAWTGPSGFIASTEDISNLYAGTYHITITDDNNCQKSDSITITENSEIVITETHQDVTCINDTDGSIDISVSGGVPSGVYPPYTYSWQDIVTTKDRTNLGVGTYQVLVMDNIGCTNVKSITISNTSSIIVISETHVNPTYGNYDGSITITISGGNPIYTFSWVGPTFFTSTSQNISTLGEGTYTVTVNGSNGCHQSRSITIMEV